MQCSLHTFCALVAFKNLGALSLCQLMGFLVPRWKLVSHSFKHASTSESKFCQTLYTTSSLTPTFGNSPSLFFASNMPFCCDTKNSIRKDVITHLYVHSNELCTQTHTHICTLTHTEVWFINALAWEIGVCLVYPALIQMLLTEWSTLATVVI